MTVTDKQARDWAWEVSKEKDWPFARWGEDRSREFELILRVMSKPNLLDGLKRERIDRWFWNVPRIYWDTVHRSGASYDRERVALTQTVPGFVRHHYAQATEPNTALEMFWDQAMTGIEQSDLTLVRAVFAALVEQLAIPNVWCQQSALHGFNHLKDPACRPIIRRFIETCEDERLKEYAKGAITFQLM